jgi:hypothetical protein
MERRPLEGVRIKKSRARKEYYYKKICQIAGLSAGKKSAQFTRGQLSELYLFISEKLKPDCDFRCTK